jgi:thioredoxin 1
MGNSANQLETDLIETVSSDSFNALILQAEGPVVVEFMSYGCAFCRTLEPILQQVAELESTKTQIFRVNIAVEEELATAYEIEGTPTLIMFQDGSKVGRSDGPPPSVEGIEMLLSEAFR